MSDNKYNPSFRSFGPNSKLPADKQQSNANLFKAATAKWDPKNKPIDDAMKVVHKANEIVLKVQQAIKPVVASGGWTDKDAIGALISHLFVEAFDSRMLFSREEMVQLVAMVYTREMMQGIEADPTMSGTPDLLSGV